MLHQHPQHKLLQRQKLLRKGEKITQSSWCLQWDLLWTSRRAGDSRPDDRQKSDATSSPAAPAGDQELVPAAPATGGFSKNCLWCPPKMLPRVTNPRAKEPSHPGTSLPWGHWDSPTVYPPSPASRGGWRNLPSEPIAAAAGCEEPVRTRQNLSRGRVYPRSEN